ncbi:hypothetical protein [Rhodanobacter denitrificans]|nr:hypothetical protein [Rhodanobacter denitrificans]UJJ53013.1 hypothetical protein LRK52_18065 [Rhodanobacter denitrificans]
MKLKQTLVIAAALVAMAGTASAVQAPPARPAPTPTTTPAGAFSTPQAQQVECSPSGECTITLPDGTVIVVT